MNYTFHILSNISKILIVLAASYFIGSLFFKKKNDHSFDNSLFYIGTGLGIFILGLTILGYLGLLYSMPIQIIIYALGFFSIYKIWINSRVEFKLVFSGIDYFQILLLIIILLFSTLYFLTSITPTLDGDSLSGYLPLAREYYNAKKMIPIDFHYGSIFPQNGQLISTLGFLLGNQITAQLFVSWLMGVLCCFILFSIGKKIENARVGLLAIVIWYGTYSVAFINQSAKIDLAWTFFDLLGIFAFMNWWFSNKYENNENWLFVSGFLISIAIGIKQVSAFTIIILVPAIFFKLFIGKNCSIRLLVKHILLFTLPIIVSFHWIFRTYLLTGDLFFTGSEFQSNDGIFGIFETIWKMSMLGNAVSHEGPMGKSIGPTLIAILPSIIIFKKNDRRIWEIIFFCLIMLIFWHNGVQRARHLFPTIALLSVCAAYLINRLIESGQKSRNIIFILVVFCSLINIGPWMYVNFISLNRIMYIKNMELDSYLEKNLKKFNWYPSFQMTKIIRDELPEKIKIAALASGNDYYLNKKFYDAQNNPLGPTFVETKKDMTSQEFYQKMKNFGITHTFLNKHVIDKWGLEECWLNDESFRNKYFIELEKDNNQYLYKLK